MMDKVLYHCVRLQCNAHRAFEMFTVNELLEAWFPVQADVEPVAGGKYELFRDPGDKENNSTIGCTVTAVEKDTLIAFEWKGPVQFKRFMNNVDPLTHVSIFFLPCANEPELCTDVHVIHSGWRNSSEWAEARKFFDKAWRAELKELMQFVNAG